MRARTKNCHQLTLPATNIAPENGCLECKFHQVSFWYGRGYVTVVSGRVPILLKQESEETEEEIAEKKFVKEPRGLFCAVKGSNLRK